MISNSNQKAQTASTVMAGCVNYSVFILFLALSIHSSAFFLAIKFEETSDIFLISLSIQVHNVLAFCIVFV